MPVSEKFEQQTGRGMTDPEKREIEQRDKKESAEARREIEEKSEGEISPELRKELLDAAKFSNTPEGLAMMNPELRAMLEDIRKNKCIYFAGDSGDYETRKGRIGLGQPAQATNEKGWRKVEKTYNPEWELLSVGFTSFPMSESNFKKSDNLFYEPVSGDPQVERVALIADKNEWKLQYGYASKCMTDAVGRAGCSFRVGIALPENEAKKLFEQLVNHPEYCREFFVMAGREVTDKFAKVIMGTDTTPGSYEDRRPDYVDKDKVGGDILFYYDIGKQWGLRQANFKNGRFYKAPLSARSKDVERYIQEERRRSEEWLKEMEERRMEKKAIEKKRKNRNFLMKGVVDTYELFGGKGSWDGLDDSKYNEF